MKIKSNPYLTIITIIFGLLLINLYVDNKLIIYLCLFLSAMAVFSLKFTKVIETIWIKLSFLLSQIIPNILLTIIFFFILTPTALLSKLFKAKSEFSSKNNKKSFFIILKKSFKKDSFKKAW